MPPCAALSAQVGIVTLQTQREVAAEAGVAESEVEVTDERVGAVVVTGSQLTKITTEDEWDDILTKPEIVFARTSPQQKLQIVSARLFTLACGLVFCGVRKCERPPALCKDGMHTATRHIAVLLLSCHAGGEPAAPGRGGGRHW